MVPYTIPFTREGKARRLPLVEATLGYRVEHIPTRDREQDHVSKTTEVMKQVKGKQRMTDRKSASLKQAVSLESPGWPGTQGKSTCLCLPSTRIKGLYQQDQS